MLKYTCECGRSFTADCSGTFTYQCECGRENTFKLHSEKKVETVAQHRDETVPPQAPKAKPPGSQVVVHPHAPQRKSRQFRMPHQGEDNYRYRKYVYTLSQIWLQRAIFVAIVGACLLGMITLLEIFRPDDVSEPLRMEDGIAKYLEEHGNYETTPTSSTQPTLYRSPSTHGLGNDPIPVLADDEVHVEPGKFERVQAVPDHVVQTVSTVKQLLKARKLSEAVQLWQPIQQQYCNSKYDCQDLEAMDMLIRTYNQFWEFLDTQLKSGIELVYHGGSERILVSEVKDTSLTLMYGKLHHYKRVLENGTSGPIHVITDASATQLTFILKGLEHQIKQFPGERYLLEAAFLLGEDDGLGARKALEQASYEAAQRRNEEQCARVTFEKVEVLWSLLATSDKVPVSLAALQ